MTRLSDVNEGINQALEVAHGGQDDRNDCIGVLPCSVEMEKESQANAGSSRRGISPATPEICADHAEATRQVNPGLCVRQLREDGQIDVADLAAGNAPVKDSPLVGTGGEVSSIASPLYLLAAEIVDIVEFDAQLRAEENDAAEECALIEASGYNDPMYERNGR